MATWSDKKLQGHKRAQSYISSGTATLGIAALGAATAKTPGARKALRRVGGAAMKRGASVKTANRIAGAPDRLGNAATSLTTASAGFGGIGGYNFAAIQSQEAKKARALRPTKKKPVMKMDTNPFDISKLSDRSKDNWVGAKIKPGREKEAAKTNLKESYKGLAAHTAGGAALGAGVMGGTAAVLNAKTHGAAWKAAKAARGATKAIGGAKGKGGGYGRKYALRSAKSSLTSRNTRNAAGAGAYGGASTGVYTGVVAGADKGHQKNRAAGNYQDRKVKKTLSSDVARSPFAKAMPQPSAPGAKRQTEGKTQPSMRPTKSLISSPVVPKPNVQPVTATKPTVAKPAMAKPTQPKPMGGVRKAYDPERKRMKRLEGYSTAATAAGGAAGALGGLKIFDAAKQGKGLVQGMDSMTGKTVKQGVKAVARTGAKGLALGAAGAGGLVAGRKIKHHSRKGGRPYKQLPLK
jgi:hypothetical protein